MVNVRSDCFLSIKTQFENAGDALINRELVRLCADNANVYVDTSRCPSKFSNMIISGMPTNVFEIRSTGRLFTIMLYRRLRGSKCFYFLSPGGYVGERKGVDGIVAKANTAVLWTMSKIGIKVCHLGVSYERIGRVHREILRYRSKFLSHHYVRDSKSADYADGMGLKVSGKMPDLAFAVPERNKGIVGSKSEIVLSFRGDQDDATAAAIRALVQELDGMVNPLYSFHFVCQVKRDQSFLQSLAQLVRNRSKRLSVVHDDLDACFAAYDSASHVISNRLHALLIGLACGATPIPLVDDENNQKIVGLFSDLSPSLEVIMLGQTGTVEQVCRKIESIAETDFLRAKRSDLQALFAKVLMG